MARLPSRRLFLRSGIAMSALPLYGCHCSLRDLKTIRMRDAVQELQRLASAVELESCTQWSWSKTLAHLAQSIEYSMQGYPQTKSPLFQKWLGQPAYALFQWRGWMHHDLTEPIPGSPAIAQDTQLQPALERLMQASEAFMQWQGPLQPHFAYGTLTRSEYETAHAMHMADHFAAFKAA